MLAVGGVSLHTDTVQSVLTVTRGMVTPSCKCIHTFLGQIPEHRVLRKEVPELLFYGEYKYLPKHTSEKLMDPLYYIFICYRDRFFFYY